MNLLIIYCGTVIVTFIGRGFNQFLFTKDLASNCLKVDRDLLKSWGSDFKLFNFKKVNFEYFIPFYNVYKSLKELVLYLQDYSFVFNELDNLNIIAPMANFEKREYAKNPSILNLFKVLKKGYIRLHNAKYHRIEDNDGKVIGEVLYEENDGDINILETYGTLDSMLKSEVIDSIKNSNVSKREEDIQELQELKEELLSVDKEKQNVKRK